MPRPKHPHKDVEAVIDDAVRAGWRFVESGGNSFCKLFCPLEDRAGCIAIVWRTPKNPGNFVKRLRRELAGCAHERV